MLTDNPYEVVNDPNIDVVVELIGGVTPAFDYISKAIENGKHIVTANKELLAKKGKELSIYGFSMKCFFILCKIVPHGVLLKAVDIIS